MNTLKTVHPAGGTHVFHRQLKSPLPVAVAGDGVYLIDADGKRYLDGSGGAAVCCLGHSDKDVIEAVRKQISTMAYAHSGALASESTEVLADFLAERAPGDLNYTYFGSGGSEAIETAMKMARQYFLEIGEPQRAKFIARQQSYHGNSLGALSLGGNELRRRPYQPLLVETFHIDPCFAYRHQKQGESDEAYGVRAANALEEKILELGPETVAAFFAETVVGATAGVVPAVKGYFKRIREICDQYGVLLVLDEVMSGMGRTGTLFAYEQEGIVPDMVTLAKGLAGGYQPIGALMLSSRIYDAFRNGSGAFQHGHTYMGHATACAAALAAQQTIERRGLLANVVDQGHRLENGLQARFADNPYVGDIRGRGLFWGVEMVADRDSKQPFDPALKLNLRIKQEAFERGLICYPMGGTADGVNGDHVLLAPPYIISADEIDLLVDMLGQAIDASLGAIGFAP